MDYLLQFVYNIYCGIAPSDSSLPTCFYLVTV